jgi:hypothetical protein
MCVAVVMLAGCGANAGSGAMLPVNGAGKSLPYHKTFYYTGGRQLFKVPDGVTKLTVIAVGARGDAETSYGEPQALGGRVWATIPVRSGETLAVFVGGAGTAPSGGFNGGGNGGMTPDCYTPCYGFGGGGASDVRADGMALSDRILVAGGGGGQGGSAWGGYGGKGGGSIGEAGSPGIYAGGGGGGGGTQYSGGAGGNAGQGSYGTGRPGSPGSLGQGGDGGAGGSGYGASGAATGGGGAGGGYYGGGGAGGAGGYYYSGSGGGGGGGSSYIEPSAYAYRSWQGWRLKTANGLVVFDW